MNTPFPDGSTARSLVRGGLPSEIEAPLRELDTLAVQSGKPVAAAAGTLLGGSVDHVRRTILSIILGARSLPTQYPQAMFCFWLRDQGTLESVRTVVEQAGKDWLKELNNLYVSPVIAKALIQVDPSFASDVRAARQVLISQFPLLSTDISTSQFIEAARKALTEDDKLPLTIIVLDEVQQYINEAADRASSITEVAEAMQTQFNSRIMLVGAGQSALSAGTPALMWLRDRFRITVGTYGFRRRGGHAQGATSQEAQRDSKDRIDVRWLFRRGGQAPSRYGDCGAPGRQERPGRRLSLAADPAALLGGLFSSCGRRRNAESTPVTTPHPSRFPPRHRGRGRGPCHPGQRPVQCALKRLGQHGSSPERDQYPYQEVGRWYQRRAAAARSVRAGLFHWQVASGARRRFRHSRQWRQSGRSDGSRHLEGFGPLP